MSKHEILKRDKTWCDRDINWTSDYGDLWLLGSCTLQDTLSQGILPLVSTTGAGPPGTVSAKASSQQHRAKQPVHGSSSPEWDRIYNPKPFVHSGSPGASCDPQWLFCVAQPETQHQDFNSRRQQCDLQKKDPKNPTPQTIQKCRLHTLSTTSTFIGNILPIQYRNGDTCFHEAVLVLESTQRVTFHEEDGIVLDCLN